MKEFLLKILAVLIVIFLLPYLIITLAIRLFRTLVLRHEIGRNENLKNNKLPFFIALFIWSLVVGWNIYQNQFYYVAYVYACPVNSNSSKCYKVPADFVSGECEDVEYSAQGTSGGRCTDPYIDKIYFNNGGHIDFSYCNMTEENMWTCYSENDADDIWELQFSERVRVRK